MGAPTSAILSEVYLQYLEHTGIYDLPRKHNTISYLRYVDDILIIYNAETNIEHILTGFNKLNKNVQLMTEKEKNNNINYLDLSTHRGSTKFEYNMYQKPSTTSMTIHFTSCHPIEQKAATFNYLKTK
jgi:hypothetical protein